MHNISFEIKALDLMIGRKIIEESKITGGCSISHVQVKILHYLISNNKNTIYQKDIEKFLCVRRSTVSGIFKTMEKNGYINRIDSKEDARRKQIILSQKTLTLAKSIKEKSVLFNELLGKNIDSKDMDTFFKVLQQMKKNISK